MFAIQSAQKLRAARVLPTLRAVLVASCSLMAGACAENKMMFSSLSDPNASSGITTASTPSTPSASAQAKAQEELRKATQYWGNIYAKDPSDGEVAYNYARNLKALGEKQQALMVLQSSVDMNPQHKGILSEYGRLALEFDQISLAQKMLERADDPLHPDWRVVSARGTVFAKQGQYAEAIPFYERALELAPEKASVLNNLALAYTMEGKAEKAEPLLRKAAAIGKDDARVQQNLALVLGPQGKDADSDAKPARKGKNITTGSTSWNTETRAVR
jgi:Flp pilus assembly protein TadD